MKLACFLFFLVLSLPSFAQDGRIRGRVLDDESKLPLELATVSLLSQDSVLMQYQLSDQLGKFGFDKLSLKKRFIISVSYTGFHPHSTTIFLNEERKSDTLEIILKVNLKDTNAIVISTTVPIRMNGDTLEINPAAFKMKNEAVVEELLNQVPGIVIWSDGAITLNGQRVQSLLVDGKPFLGSSDTRIATQNLPKTAIEKIQLYQEYDRSNIGREPKPTDSLLTMNIKLKESAKRGYFGKAGVGHGTDKRYDADLSLQMYTKKASLGVGGGVNNINRNIESLQEIFANNTFRNTNPNLFNVGRFGTPGINRNYSIGGLYAYNFIATENSRQNDRLRINYTNAGSETDLTDLNIQERALLNVAQFVRDEGQQKNYNYRNDVSFNYSKTNSYNDNFGLNGTLGISTGNGSSKRSTQVRNESGELLSVSQNISKDARRSENEYVGINYAKFDGDNPLENYNLQVNARRSEIHSKRTQIAEFESFIDATKNSRFNREYTNDNETVNLSGALVYSGFKRLLLGRYNLFGINLQLHQPFNYLKSHDNVHVNDYDSSVNKFELNEKLTYQNQREVIEYTPTLSLSKNFSTWSEPSSRNVNLQFQFVEEIKYDKNLSSIVKRNLDRSFTFFRYEGNVNYSFQKRQKFRYDVRLNYAKSYQYPSITQLYTIVDDINAYDIRIGNPRLKNAVLHRTNMGANYYTQNPKWPYTISFSINGSYNWSLNGITDSLINETSGKRTIYYVNGSQTDNVNVNYNLNLARKWQKTNLQLVYSGTLFKNTTANFLDNVSNKSIMNSLSHQVNLQFSLKTILVFNVSRSIQQVATKQSAAGLRAFKNSGHTTRVGVVLNAPTNFSISSSVEQVNNSNLNRVATLWNAFANYRFMKQKGELKFSAMDILKQYQNITNYATAFGTTTRITNGLQQYFLLSFSYYPRKFGSTDNSRQGTQTVIY